MNASRLLPLFLLGFLGACNLVSPYTITFTNAPGSVVDPQNTTLDLVVSQPTLAYISRVECSGSEAFELLPIVSDSEQSSTVHKLSLSLLSEQVPASDCEITVTVFDRTTTEDNSASIHLTIAGEAPAEALPSEESSPVTEEAMPVEENDSNGSQGLVPDHLAPSTQGTEAPVSEEPTSLEPVPMPDTSTPSENTGIVPPQY